MTKLEEFVIDGRPWDVHESEGRIWVLLREPRPGIGDHWRFSCFPPAPRTAIDAEWLPILGRCPASASAWERRCAREAARRYWMRKRGLRECSIKDGPLWEPTAEKALKAVSAPTSRQEGRAPAAAAPGRTRTEDARKRRPRGTRQG